MDDFYAILEVPCDASPEMIRTKYLELALCWHPDRNHDASATEQFQRINIAYENLRNPHKRMQYDKSRIRLSSRWRMDAVANAFEMRNWLRGSYRRTTPDDTFGSLPSDDEWDRREREERTIREKMKTAPFPSVQELTDEWEDLQQEAFMDRHSASNWVRGDGDPA
jgi:curved DNA-binding protein CbpA